MDIKSLKRADGVIEECLKEIGDTLVAVKNCAIVVPFRFLQAKLLDFGKSTYVAAIFPLINEEGQYSVVNFCTKMEITPSSVEIIKYEGEEQYVFNFEKGDVVCPDVNAVMDDNATYLIYDEFIQKAKAPWYLNYRDVGLIMTTVKSHGGVWLSDTNAIFEIIVASLSRNEDLTKYYREVVSDLKDSTLAKHPRQAITLNSVIYSTVNKMNKMMGGYIEDGLSSALTEKENAQSGVELMLRKQ